MRFPKAFGSLEIASFIRYTIGMNSVVEQLQEQIEQLQNEVTSLKIQNNELSNMVNWYQEQIRVMNIQKFKGKSEPADVYQLSLFDEVEFIKETEPEESEETIEIPAHTRKKKTKPDYSKMELKVIHRDVKDKKGLAELKPTIKEEIEYTPAKVRLIRYVIHNYIDKNHSDDEHTVIISGDNHKKLIDKSMASPSLVAGIIDEKFVKGMPLYRTEADFNRKGIPIRRKDMSSWLLLTNERYLSLLVGLMKEDIKKEDIWYGDETTVRCLEEKDREKSYMWIQRTSPASKRQIALYHYNASREYDFAKDIYKGFKGYLHADAYGAYNDLKDIIVVGCWAHVRRRVYEALEGYPVDSKVRNCRSREEQAELLRANPSYAKMFELFEMIEKLFSVDKKIRKETSDFEEIKKLRIEKERPILDDIFNFAKEHEDKFLAKSKSGSAIKYIIDCMPNLDNYLLDGRLELTNNLGERTVKAFVMGRKAWLFANTARGAQCSADLYSLCQTAIANDLKPYEYLEYVLDKMRVMKDEDKTPENLRKLLPYSSKLPRSVRK